MASVVAAGVLAVPQHDRLTATQGWTAPRTGDGQPDLQGVWLSNIAAPLERPAEFADRARLTDEEVAALRARAVRIFENGRSAFTTPEGAFAAAVRDVDTYEAQSTSSSIGMVDLEFWNRTSLVVSPADGRIPGLTAAARQRRTAVDDGWRDKTGPEDLNNIHRCITTGVPRLGGNFGAGPYTYYQLIQNANIVVLLSEAYHDARVIPLDGRPHLPTRIRQWNGDSRGRWDGASLEVETRNFSVGSYYQGSADGLHLMERFTRTDADTLIYRVTLTDPTTWASSWTAELPLKRREQPIYEFACHEGNRSLVGMLRTARMEDRRR